MNINDPKAGALQMDAKTKWRFSQKTARTVYIKF
jgi:hypothetical protein